MVLRTEEEFEKIISDCPYDFVGLKEGESIHIAFLTKNLQTKGLILSDRSDSGSEECEFKDKEGYFLFREGVRNSKLAVQVQKLGVPATMWNVKINKLAEMVGEMKG